MTDEIAGVTTDDELRRMAVGAARVASMGVTTACFIKRHDDCSQRPGCGCECHQGDITE